MKNQKLKVGLLIFLAGSIGALSLLAFDLTSIKFIADNLPVSVTKWELKLVSLINPLMMVTVFTVLGTVLYEKVGYPLPVFESIVDRNTEVNLKQILIKGIIGGMIAGVGIVISTVIAFQFLPQKYLLVLDQFQLPLITKLLYGGIAEEVIMRFGLQTFLTWILFKVFKNLNLSVILAILISAILFALGHFPILYLLFPEPSSTLLVYIIVGNSIGGIVFGYLYWKIGLSAAMIAHMVTHIVMILLSSAV